MNPEFQEGFNTAKKARTILDNLWAAMTEVEIAVGEVEANTSNLKAAIRRAPEVSWAMYRTTLKDRETARKACSEAIALGAQLFAELQRTEELPDVGPEAQLLAESVSLYFWKFWRPCNDIFDNSRLFCTRTSQRMLVRNAPTLSPAGHFFEMSGSVSKNLTG